MLRSTLTKAIHGEVTSWGTALDDLRNGVQRLHTHAEGTCNP
jgi:hypothetical protein